MFPSHLNSDDRHPVHNALCKYQFYNRFVITNDWRARSICVQYTSKWIQTVDDQFISGIRLAIHIIENYSEYEICLPYILHISVLHASILHGNCFSFNIFRSSKWIIKHEMPDSVHRSGGPRSRLWYLCISSFHLSVQFASTKCLIQYDIDERILCCAVIIASSPRFENLQFLKYAKSHTCEMCHALCNLNVPANPNILDSKNENYCVL